MRIFILLIIILFNFSSFGQKEKSVIKEEVGLIFFSSFYTYDSSGNFNHGIENFDATDDYFIPVKKYKKCCKLIDLFKSNNLKKGFILSAYPQRNKIINAAAEYINNLDSASCYFTSSFKLLMVKIKYKISSRNEALFCNKNNSIIFSDNRLIKFSYYGLTREIIEIKPL